MKVIESRDPATAKVGMKLTATMWFADREKPDQAFVEWWSEVAKLAELVGASWIEIRGEDVPPIFEDVFAKKQPNLTIIR